MDIKDLLGLKSDTQTITAVQLKSNERTTGETYQHWGHRAAGQCNGSNTALPTHLHVVEAMLRKEQEANEEKQDELRRDIQKQIDDKETIKGKNEIQQESIEKELEKIKTDIATKNKRISELKSDNSKRNKETFANFVLGVIILVPLTLYLFLFYSSTAYSAFFKEIDYTETISDLIFEPRALVLAFQMSIATGLLILTITFIFLALGYLLHQFSQQEGYGKYIKTAGLVVITFLFDMLLAYSISKRMYDAWTLTQIGDVPPFDLQMAYADSHFWLVIFCGFVAYIIWGLLFSFVMENYNKLDSVKVEIDGLKREIGELDTESKKKNEALVQVKTEIRTIQGEINKLKRDLERKVRYDYNVIKLELGNFMNGWLQYLANMYPERQDEAKTHYDNFIKTYETTLKANDDSEPKSIA